jgi:LPS-assembly protein
MARFLARIFGAAWLFTLGGIAAAQDLSLQETLQIEGVDSDQPLVVVADQVIYETDGSVASAVGDAEAFYGPRVLGADRLEYDQGTERVRAIGAVMLRNDDGTLLFADEADLSTSLQDGKITQPRALIAGGARFAAVEGERIDGRYTVLSKAVYSPCLVCFDDPTPLWRVRAAKVIHDEVTRDIVYEDATFEVEGVPVMYVPYFRHPDPSVQRRTGFLAPEFGEDSNYGYSVKLPYFIELSPSRDLTLTPFITTKDGLIMEAEYRALTRSGGYRLRGSLTYNDEQEGTGGEWRGALEGEGRFSIAQDLGWGFDLDLATDDTFLRRYNYSDEDRVTSRLFLVNENDRLFAEANAYYFQSFRPDEDDDTIPMALPELRVRYRALEDQTYGVANLTADVLHLQRNETRDVTRFSTGATWERQFVSDLGIVITPFGQVRADAYWFDNDPTRGSDTELRVNALAGVDVRMPFIAENTLGTHIIEPVVQLVASPNDGSQIDIPNEDSLDLNFDETNLLIGESRFAGIDRFEAGSRLNAGIRYDFTNDSGFGVEAVYGRVFRLEDNDAFSQTSGLRNADSDHVGALRLKFDPYFDVTARFRADQDDFDLERREVYARGSYGPVSAVGSYAHIAADAFGGFASDRQEIAGKAILRINEEVRLHGSARHDLEDGRLVDAEGGVIYENECCFIDFSVSRRNNDDRDAEDGTNFGLTFRLKSLGA